MKTFPTSAVWCLGILFISVSLITTGSSEVQVVGPADPVDALAGDDIILPCSLKPKASAETMIVRWTRLNLTTENVHLYRDGRDSNEDQSPSYRGRTSMFNEELKNGNVSLKLTRVTLSDAGSYMCFIPTLTSQVKETTVQLLVGAVSQPVTSIIGTKGGGVVLKCESGGWFPEPEMEWLDSSGTILPADGPPERHRDPEGLYTVRRHVTVNQTDTNRFTCRVNQTEINHLKETEIHVPDDVFPKSHVGLIVGLLAAAVVVLTASAGGVYWWRKHMKEKEQRQRLEERRDALFVTRHKDHLIHMVSKGKSIASELHQKDLIPDEMNSQISAARTSQDQMRLLFLALEEAEDTTRVKSAFYRILLDLEPDVVKDLEEQRQRLEELRDALFVTRHKDHLIHMVSKGKSIASELHQKDLIPDEMNSQISAARTSQDQMRLLFLALEEAEDTTRVKSAFYRILLDLEPDVVKDLEEQRQRLEELQKKIIKDLEERVKDYKLEQEKRRDVLFVDRHKDHLIQRVSKGKSIASELHQKDLIPDEMNSQISAAGTSQDQMRLLFKALGRKKVKSDFYRILLDLEPDVVIEVGASFVDDHKDQLIQKVTQVKPIMYELFYEELYGNIKINQMNRQEQMRLLYEALEEAEDTRRVKSDFYRILLDLEPDVVKDLDIYDDYFGLFNLIDIYDDDISLFNLFEEEQRQRWEELRDAQFVTRHKDHLIQNVSKGKSIASELHQKDLIPDEMNSQISAARTSQDQMRLLFKALEEAENTTRVKSTFYRILLDLEPDVVKDLKKEQRQRWEEREKKRREELEEQSDAQFVNKHKDHLIQMVSKGESIASELHQKDLIPDEMNSQISAAGTSQDQMRLLFKALEEAEDTTRVKSTFYKILLDLEPDVVKDLNVNKMKAPKKLRKENEKLRKENEKLRKENDELKEKLRKAEETNQSLSTSPGGQQKTQTPSQKSEGIEGMEMESLPGRKSGPGPGRKSAPEMESLPGRKSAPEMESLPGRKSAPEMESLPGRKSAPEMKPLLAAGPQKEDLYDLERGGRDTTEFNYRETIPSGRKSGPEKEMEMKPLLGPGPQKDDLDELEREEELLQNLTMCYRVTIERL
ncbi:selection and upkeep of intraepithelial T-cells protein 5 isoform X3 [Salmo salar]|uniref:Selection and upkeep of intraepithelial T-cells protein 5 isoform X3 n=1 Tax=Salmo salar TaxID=8030 RepID=A0ABM3E9L8_SALSA|nr:selection and upkeep of intraepithelial T-cells protein 5-like isoform X3 [Salmo salar]